MTKYDPVKYRVVFASGSPIGVPFLEALMQDPRFEVVGVLTMPDKPSGRGMKLRENIIAEQAKKLWLQESLINKSPSLRLDSKKYASEARETHERLQDVEPDFIYTIAYGHIIPQAILDIPKIAPINIHGSLLPEYRGASPLQQVFVDGRSETWVTLMKIEAGLDSGPMIDKQVFKLWFTDTVADLISKIKSETPSWSLDALDRFVHTGQEVLEQDESEATFCGKIKKEDGEIIIKNWKWRRKDWEYDTLEIMYRKYKWYYLWPKIYFELVVDSEQLRIIVEQLKLDEELYKKHKNDGLFIDDEYNLNPAVVSLKVKPQWKQAMKREDFKNGYLRELKIKN